MAFFDELSKVISTAKSLLPLVALANPQAATGIASAEAIMSVVKPLVDGIDQYASSQTTPMTGPQKLAMAMSAVQSAVTMAQQQGITTSNFDQHWAVVNPAITAICAAKKAPGVTA